MSSTFDLASMSLAAANGDFKAIEEDLNKGVSPDGVDDPTPHWTPLMSAASGGHVDAAKLLIERKATIDFTDSHQQTALDRACQDGRMGTVELLVNCKANVNHLDEDGALAFLVFVLRSNFLCLSSNFLRFSLISLSLLLSRLHSQAGRL